VPTLQAICPGAEIDVERTVLRRGTGRAPAGLGTVEPSNRPVPPRSASWLIRRSTS